jgi:3-dehydroquinate synthase
MDTRVVTIDLDSRSYDIYIGSGLLYRLTDYLPDEIEGKTLFIVADKNTQSYADRMKAMLLEGGARVVETYVIPDGEQAKTMATAEKVIAWLLDNQANRDSMLFAVGGGVVGDITGFCASVTMRGIPYIQVPTTLLAQVDSSVGGKTGVNTAHGKNLIGSFYQPAAVIADLETSNTV